MKILIMGQCTLHWGRMEFGNIGNFYIMEPLMRELHRVFPNSTISTTFQMSSDFCIREKVSVLPMELYYGWTGQDLNDSLAELAIAQLYATTGNLVKRTPYIDAVMDADLVIDFSGDIWGDNADLLGPDRFFVGLCKDRVAQLLGKKTVMIAGSPGPFGDERNLAFAQEVFRGFDLVTNREPVSNEILKNNGFHNDNMRAYACPAFLFQPASGDSIEELLRLEGIIDTGKPTVGFILCGWNFLEAPFDKWPRRDTEYEMFAEAIEFMEHKLDHRVCLMSHSNGFPVPPKPFHLQHGRDYPVTKQLQAVLTKRGIAKNFFALDGVYDAWMTKAIIGRFDMLVSGRIHAAVAGFSQNVPTVVIDYGHEPKAHKLHGFATVAGMEQYVADPARSRELIEKVGLCWEQRKEIRKGLAQRMPKVKELVRANFKALKEVMIES